MTSDPITVFSSSKASGFKVGDYLSHLLKHVESSPAVVIVTLIYVERLLEAMDARYRKAGG